ncbi:DNA primase [Streptomyces thermoalcalitolerans]|uniref:DNA primase n=1 Tax=Streptomyces thermoalcalitolerans TaxID=65605 RepID=A0ABN1NJ78_9ACTN
MNRMGLGLAIGAGYVLGRTKKAKLALAVGSMVAGKKLKLSPGRVAELVNRQLQDNPQIKEIGDQLRQDLRGVGKAASGAMVERQMTALADRLHGRTSQVRDQLAGVAPETGKAGKAAGTGGNGEADEADEERTVEGEAEYEDREGREAEEPESADELEEEPEEPQETEEAEDEPVRKGAAKKAAAKKAAAKKPPAKKTAKKAPAGPPAKKAAKKAPAKKATKKPAAAGSRPSKGGGDR